MCDVFSHPIVMLKTLKSVCFWGSPSNLTASQMYFLSFCEIRSLPVPHTTHNWRNGLLKPDIFAIVWFFKWHMCETSSSVGSLAARDVAASVGSVYASTRVEQTVWACTWADGSCQHDGEPLKARATHSKCTENLTCDASHTCLHWAPARLLIRSLSRVFLGWKKN